MTHAAFAPRLNRRPIPFDRDAGAGVARSYSDLGPDLALLLAGAAGCSPYLNGLMAREGDWLRRALATAPETAFADLLAPLDTVPLDGLGPALRVAKRRVALLTALADWAASGGLRL
jgi:glutamate-ammonia-ligase adenylyltransferase